VHSSHNTVCCAAGDRGEGGGPGAGPESTEGDFDLEAANKRFEELRLEGTTASAPSPAIGEHGDLSDINQCALTDGARFTCAGTVSLASLGGPPTSGGGSGSGGAVIAPAYDPAKSFFDTLGGGGGGGGGWERAGPRRGGHTHSHARPAADGGGGGGGGGGGRVNMETFGAAGIAGGHRFHGHRGGGRGRGGGFGHGGSGRRGGAGSGGGFGFKSEYQAPGR